MTSVDAVPYEPETDDGSVDLDPAGIRAEFDRVVDEVWSSMMGISLPAGDPALDGSITIGGLTVIVQINGAWEGAVAVGCSETLAEQIASTMLGVDIDELDSETLADALGEMANILTGNIKAILPGPSSIGLPTVIQGRDPVEGIPGVVVTCQATLRHRDESLAVALLERT